MRAPKPCLRCAALEVQLAASLARVGDLEAEVATLRAQLREALKLIELQRADLERLRAERAATPVPNHPERVPPNHLAAAYARVIEAFAAVPAASDGTRPPPPPPPAAPARDPDSALMRNARIADDERQTLLAWVVQVECAFGELLGILEEREQRG